MHPLDEPIDGAIIIPPLLPTVIKYGLIGGGIFVLLSLIVFLFDVGITSANSLKFSSGYLIFSFILYLLLMIFAIKEHRDQRSGGYITLAHGVLVGFGSLVIASALSLLFQVFYMLVIDPDYVSRNIRRSYQQSGLDQNTINNLSNYSNTLFIVGQVSGFIVTALLGLLLALLVGLVMKKEHPNLYHPKY